MIGSRSARHVGLSTALVAVLAACGTAERPADSVATAPRASTSEAQATRFIAPAVPPAIPTETPVHAVNDGVPVAPRRSDGMTAAVPAGAAAPDFAALELVGTSIDAGKRFALVKRRDDALLTLDQGSQLSGYTVASIEPDRVTLTSPSGARAVILLAGSDPASPAIGSARYAAESRLITDGVNTDQSLPKDPVWGPTARLPEGVKQIGH